MKPTRTNRSQPRRTMSAKIIDRLSSLIDQSQRAMPSNVHLHGEAGHEKSVELAGMSAVAGMSDAFPIGVMIPSLVAQDGLIDIDPPRQSAGTEVPLATIMARSSLTLTAGAHLIEIPETMVPVGAGRTILATRKVQFGTFEPAEFSVVDFDADPEAEVPTSAPPFKNFELDPDTLISRALSFRLTRRQMNEKSRERLASELVWSIAQGMGRAVDATVFDAVTALPANPWSIPKAAAAGATFAALRAFVGRNGQAASPVEGELYVDGVQGSLTPDLAPTVIGSWSRAAVVIDPDIQIQVGRLSLQGDVEITVWLSMKAMIPDPAFFWTVA